MSKNIFIPTMLLFIAYILWKVASVYIENKKLTNSLNALKEKNKQRAEDFKLSNQIGDFMIDFDNHLFKFKGLIQLFHFTELNHFELVVNNKKIDSFTNHADPSKLLMNYLVDLKEVNNIDLVFYVSGLNEGRYTHQFLYKPIRTKSDDYQPLISLVNQTLITFQQIKNHDLKK